MFGSIQPLKAVTAGSQVALLSGVGGVGGDVEAGLVGGAGGGQVPGGDGQVPEAFVADVVGSGSLLCPERSHWSGRRESNPHDQLGGRTAHQGHWL